MYRKVWQATGCGVARVRHKLNHPHHHEINGIKPVMFCDHIGAIHKNTFISINDNRTIIHKSINIYIYIFFSMSI